MSDRKKLRERERRLSVLVFLAVTMLPRPSESRSSQINFHLLARELIPDVQPDEVRTALMLAGQYSEADAAGVVAAADAIVERRRADASD